MIRFAAFILFMTSALTLAAEETPTVFRDAGGTWFLCSKTTSHCGYGRSRAEATEHLRQISEAESDIRHTPEVDKGERFLRDRKIDRKLEELELRITIIENNKR